MQRLVVDLGGALGPGGSGGGAGAGPCTARRTERVVGTSAENGCARELLLCSSFAVQYMSFCLVLSVNLRRSLSFPEGIIATSCCLAAQLAAVATPTVFRYYAIQSSWQYIGAQYWLTAVGRKVRKGAQKAYGKSPLSGA